MYRLEKMKTHSILTSVILLTLDVCYTQSWRGHYMTVRGSNPSYARYCASWYWWWGCSLWRGYWHTNYFYDYQCQPGWTHDGDRNCIIPICRPTCINGGRCQNPNDCSCASWSTGRFSGCSTMTCSYIRPCYPGDCAGGTMCTCEPGFLSGSASDGCIVFNSSHTELQPVVGKSNVTLSNIRRTDNRTDFMFTLEGTYTSSNNLEIIWVNQKRFNNLRFEYETYFKQPNYFPERPTYISRAGLGIVESTIDVNISKVSRSGRIIRDPGYFQTYPCEGGFSKENPASELASCVVNDDQFRILIEHGDWMNIKFKSNSGGFQKLINLDNQGLPYATKYYRGLQDVKEVQFNFDFIAPKHCSEVGSWGSCTSDAEVLLVEKEFTKDPIRLFWKGWTDDLSGVFEYFVEVFKLDQDSNGRLTEMSPLKPVYSAILSHSQRIDYPVYIPKVPGMHSILLETRDLANNSRITRRFVLYDNQSEIILNNVADSFLFTSSAVQETGYKWQATTAGHDVTIQVTWGNHFINKLHEDNNLLNAIEPYPTQFKDIQDDGVLFSQKYVAMNLDDRQGERTREAIKNYHGIVKFEISKEFTLSELEPTIWEIVAPFEERTSFQTKLEDGGRVRVWIRATDVMGNIKTDNTLVRVDSSPPSISKESNEDHKFVPNVEDGKFNFTSRLRLLAADQQSGVHKLGFTITISTPGKPDRDVYSGFSPASTWEDNQNPMCNVIGETCFISKQMLELDNCWFMTMKSELETSTAVVTVTAYNQALLNTSVAFKIGHVKQLKGLEKYDGPRNIRIESSSSNGFRVAWDLPDNALCFGRAEIVLVLLQKSAEGNIELHTYYTPGTGKYFDILGLTPATEYEINFGMKTPYSSETQMEISLLVKTKQSASSGALAGVYVGNNILILLSVTLLVLILRGYIHPPEQTQQMSRTLSKRVRSSVWAHEHKKRYSDLYIYGETNMAGPQIWHIDRNVVTKSDKLANILQARLKRRKSGKVLVTQTFKDGYTTDDEYAMKAMNTVEDHPNILKFIGAVVNDETCGTPLCKSVGYTNQRSDQHSQRSGTS